MTEQSGPRALVRYAAAAGFAGATQFVRPGDVADAIPCGPDLDEAAGPLLERLRAA